MQHGTMQHRAGLSITRHQFECIGHADALITTAPRKGALHHKEKTMETKKRKHVSRRFRRFAKANEAVSALEYAILIGAVAVGVAAAMSALKTDVVTAITDLRTEAKNAGTTLNNT